MADSGADNGREIVRAAECAVGRAAWNVHCIEYDAENAEDEGAKQGGRAVEARAKLAARQDALVAIRAQFPEVEPQEVDLHGIV